MPKVTNELVRKYGPIINKIPDTSLKDMEEILEYFYNFNSGLQKELYHEYKNTSIESTYLMPLMHETNSEEGRMINHLRNYYHYLKEDKRRADEIRKKFFTNFSAFLLHLKSLEVFYNYVYKKEA